MPPSPDPPPPLLPGPLAPLPAELCAFGTGPVLLALSLASFFASRSKWPGGEYNLLFLTMTPERHDNKLYYVLLKRLALTVHDVGQ
jgi:hypothetical protein